MPAAVGIVREDAGAGLLRVASAADDGVVLVSTRGQPPQSFGFTRADFRYAGAVPYHLAWRGRVLCPPPVQVERAALLDDPCLAGWTPIFLIGDRLYGLTDFSTVTVEALPEMQGRRVTLSGRPVQLLRAPAQGILRRFVSALDWRFCDGALLRRRAALRREQADEIEARVVITIVPAVPRLECIVAVDYRGGRPARWLNPCGHALVAAEPFVRRCRLRDADASTDAARELSLASVAFVSAGWRGYCLPALERAGRSGSGRGAGVVAVPTDCRSARAGAALRVCSRVDKAPGAVRAHRSGGARDRVPHQQDSFVPDQLRSQHAGMAGVMGEQFAH